MKLQWCFKYFKGNWLLVKTIRVISSRYLEYCDGLTCLTETGKLEFNCERVAPARLPSSSSSSAADGEEGGARVDVHSLRAPSRLNRVQYIIQSQQGDTSVSLSCQDSELQPPPGRRCGCSLIRCGWTIRLEGGRLRCLLQVMHDFHRPREDREEQGSDWGSTVDVNIAMPCLMHHLPAGPGQLKTNRTSLSQVNISETWWSCSRDRRLQRATGCSEGSLHPGCAASVLCGHAAGSILRPLSDLSFSLGLTSSPKQLTITVTA